jgi:hypothetical protein
MHERVQHSSGRLMPYKISKCVCFQAPDLNGAKVHFQGLGMTVVAESEDSVELAGGELRLFIDLGPEMGPIMELIVPDLEEAQKDLVSQGWTVVLWEGLGRRCYLRNSMGTLFNLFEDPTAFEDQDGEEDLDDDR